MLSLFAACSGPDEEPSTPEMDNRSDTTADDQEQDTASSENEGAEAQNPPYPTNAKYVADTYADTLGTNDEFNGENFTFSDAYQEEDCQGCWKFEYLFDRKDENPDYRKAKFIITTNGSRIIKLDNAIVR